MTRDELVIAISDLSLAYRLGISMKAAERVADFICNHFDPKPEPPPLDPEAEVFKIAHPKYCADEMARLGEDKEREWCRRILENADEIANLAAVWREQNKDKE